MTSNDFDRWVGRYKEAWESNDPDQIGALFTADAEYYTAPFRPPWRGRQAILTGWIDRKDAPGDHEFRHEVLAVTDDLGFIRGWTRYPGKQPEAYSNLWVIRLTAEGQASSFTEWWMVEDQVGPGAGDES